MCSEVTVSRTQSDHRGEDEWNRVTEMTGEQVKSTQEERAACGLQSPEKERFRWEQVSLGLGRKVVLWTGEHLPLDELGGCR